MCGIGSDARGFLHNDKGAVVSEALVDSKETRRLEANSDSASHGI